MGRFERKLPDGTTILHEVRGRVARDSEGRFREEEQEVVFPNRPIHFAVIDPVKHVQWRWSSDSNDAVVLPLPRVGNLRITFPLPLVPGWPVERGGLDLPQPRAVPDNVRTTDLGKKTISGLLIVGTRTTTVVSVGKLGNDRPLKIVQDVWTSSDLNLVVQESLDDPLVGKQTFEIQGIARTEPDPALFALPGGYREVGPSVPAQPSVANLTNMRPVRGIVPDKQNYLVLDENIWQHARHDLGDLRLFVGDTEVPYAMALERGGESAQKAEAKLLNIGREEGTQSGTAAGTQFVIDMAGIPLYDAVELRLADSAKNFVAQASVEGLRSASDALGTDLGSSVLFNLSNEGLGSDFTLKFRPATFPFLRVHVARITPDQVLRAIGINTHAQPASWTPISGSLPIEQKGRTTVVTWSGSESVPVSRVVLDVDPSQTNFWRDIEVLTPTGGTVTNTSVRRVHLARDGKLAESESLAIELPYEAWGGFQIVIENADEPPLKITAAKAYFYERRLYFESHGGVDLNLYSGDPRLTAPSYEYSRVFRADENAAEATLGLDSTNPNYHGGLLQPR